MSIRTSGFFLYVCTVCRLSVYPIWKKYDILDCWFCTACGGGDMNQPIGGEEPIVISDGEDQFHPDVVAGT